MSAAHILVIDDDRAFRLSTAALLHQEGHEVAVAADASEAVALLRAAPVDLVLLDLRMPGLDGIALAEVLRQWGHAVPILMISGVGTVDDAVAALHTGVDDFLTKPVEPDVLAARVARLLEQRPLLHRAALAAPGDLLGRTPAMHAVFDAIRRVAPAHTTVLITGETGTGKELVARAVHDLSARRSGPFVPVNCAALAEGVLESELFGHVRGAFTGALRDRDGLFRAAHGGTLFLDEVGDISPHLQHRLLRVLQEREVVPVGAVRAVPVDVRVIAATHRDLRGAIAAGIFREDLYYRLNVFRIALPPLRERRADIPLLIEHVLDAHRQAGGARATCSPLAMRMLQAYDWPGNVRELLAVLESALLRADAGRIEAQHLPPEIRGRHGAPGDETTGARYRGDVSQHEERARIASALAQASGVRAAAADLLGMGRTTLWRKMKKYGLDAPADGDDRIP